VVKEEKSLLLPLNQHKGETLESFCPPHCNTTNNAVGQTHEVCELPTDWADFLIHCVSTETAPKALLAVPAMLPGWI
jgi:hypothetical protein